MSNWSVSGAHSCQFRKLRVTIHQLTSLTIDKKTEVAEEVGSNDAFVNVCDNKYPLKNATKADVESEGAFPEGSDGSVIDSS